uniref:Lzipper-MIP1 domain-containing protein n=1 Tax=Caenorhabditis tropicalis TaxID=1561998 RepID=A0A1I7U341_9PELO
MPIEEDKEYSELSVLDELTDRLGLLCKLVELKEECLSRCSVIGGSDFPFSEDPSLSKSDSTGSLAGDDDDDEDNDR